ncbi:Flp family type IVb pilin [Roseicyclus sp.]|uniref:Flp family type IVb pilin n=1 Tax=Roseicyclus sp. TaxID=1914329 RepID=UPI003FA05BB1
MLRKFFLRLRDDERGVTLVEYGIALTLAVIVGTVALLNLGNAVTGEMTQAETVMTGN